MPKAAIFDIDGTLVDSVDLHALAWCEAFIKFGHKVSFEQARSQIGNAGRTSPLPSATRSMPDRACHVGAVHFSSIRGLPQVGHVIPQTNDFTTVE